MAVVAAQKKKRKDEEKKKAAAAAMFNQQQIALEKERAQKAAQRKWEAEQEAERAKAALEAQIIQESLDGIVERGAAAAAQEKMQWQREVQIQHQTEAESFSSMQEVKTPDSNYIARSLSSATGGYLGSQYGALVPNVLKIIGKLGGPNNPDIASVAGYVHENLWVPAHNTSISKLIGKGWAWLNPNRTAKGWDGGISNLTGTKQVQLKSINPEISSYRTQTNKLARLSESYGPDQELLVTNEAANDVAGKSATPERVGSSGVDNAEAETVTRLGQESLRGSTSSLIKLSLNMANKAAVKAGGIGALISGGISLVRNIRDVSTGRISGSAAVARTTVDTLGGTVTAATGAWAGAMTGALAGAALGSVIPVAGNIIGAVVGFGVGVATSVGVGTLWNNHIKEPLTNFIDHGLSAYSGIAQNVKIIANEVVDRVSETVTDAVETVKSTVSNAVNNVVEGASNFFGNIFGKKS